ncbi:MAG: YggT family protein [Caulobacteraceae bacterium]|nr:YggT family protein [Caulobacteraceae bacterium]
MNALLNFLEFVLQALLSLAVWVVILYAVLSWLVSFNVVNLRNRAVYQISRVLEGAARPLLAPFQRLLPAMGGLDFSPILFLIVVEWIKRYLIPPLFGWLHTLVGGPVAV